LHVLLLCTHFPPLNRTGARRPYYLARQLRDEGHQVSVLTSTETEDATWEVDLGGISVMRCPRTHLQRDMHPWQRTIAKAHHRIQGKFLHGPLRVLSDLLLPLDHGSRWDVLPEEIEQRFGIPDVVLATAPGWSTAETGMRLANVWNATFLVDYRDPWSIIDPSLHMDIVTGHGKGLAGILRKAVFKQREKKIGSAAFAITAVSDGVLRNAQQVTRNFRGSVFTGGYDPDIQPAAQVRNGKFTLVYTGRVYPEQDWGLVMSGLDRLSTAIEGFHDHFILRMIGTVSNDPSLLRDLQATAERTHAMELIPRMPREEALREQHAADALLHLTYRGRKGFLPVKFLEYLNADRPILLVTKEEDIMESILIRTGTGILIPDARSFIDLIQDRLAQWKEGLGWKLLPDCEALREFAYPERMRPWVEQIWAWDIERRSSIPMPDDGRYISMPPEV